MPQSRRFAGRQNAVNEGCVFKSFCPPVRKAFGGSSGAFRQTTRFSSFKPPASLAPGQEVPRSREYMAGPRQRQLPLLFPDPPRYVSDSWHHRASQVAPRIVHCWRSRESEVFEHVPSPAPSKSRTMHLSCRVPRPRLGPTRKRRMSMGRRRCIWQSRVPTAVTALLDARTDGNAWMECGGMASEIEWLLASSGGGNEALHRDRRGTINTPRTRPNSLVPRATTVGVGR